MNNRSREKEKKKKIILRIFHNLIGDYSVKSFFCNVCFFIEKINYDEFIESVPKESNVLF